MAFYRLSRLQFGLTLFAVILTVPSFGQAAPKSDEHLSQWYAHHANLNWPQLVDTLEKDTGLLEMPPRVQQSYLRQLRELYDRDHPKQHQQTPPAPQGKPVNNQPS
jgi:hypothetical protein